MADPVQEPPVYDSAETFGMKGWFQSVYNWIYRNSKNINVSAAYTVPSNIFYVRADATSGAFTVTLPLAATNKGRKILITKIDSSVNAITVSRSGSDTIEGATTISLGNQWNKAFLISNDNNGWERIV